MTFKELKNMMEKHFPHSVVVVDDNGLAVVHTYCQVGDFGELVTPDDMVEDDLIP